MKKLDKLMITTFIPPFIVTFMIAIFVLLMQILWLYIDDIAGKGVGFFIIIELLAYKCVGLVPMALPLAALISSVMVLGGLAEHYELSSFKSAGVRLLRVMRPIIFFGVAMTFLSWLCSDYIIPVANLKFGSRMYDIQQKKPALSLDAGMFNYDFTDYAIHIGSKQGDGRTINDVLIYDHTQSSTGNLSSIVAGEGEMFASTDGRFFVMNLKEGYQYSEMQPTTGRRDGYPFVRTSFDRWTKVFDLSEFQMARTNEKLFEQNRSMMSSPQLAEAVDSIEFRIEERRIGLANHLAVYFSQMESDTSLSGLRNDKTGLTLEDSIQYGLRDSLAGNTIDSVAADSSDRLASDTSAVTLKKNVPPLRSADRRNLPNVLPQEKTIDIVRDTFTASLQTQRKTIREATVSTEERVLLGMTKDSIGMDSLLKALSIQKRERIYNRARSTARSIQSQAESATRTIDRMAENRVKHIYDLHRKFSMAVVCIIFVFIGAPMGAIVRKGGFGYPILVSIIFFMIFVILTIFCQKIAESFILTATTAAWIPCIVLFPVGLILTVRAMNDSKVVDSDRYTRFFRKLFKRKKEAEAVATPPSAE